MKYLATLLLFIAVPSLAGNSIGCPKGTTPNGETTPDVSEAWCEVTKDGQTVQHGPYRSWWPNGKPGNEGQYEYGKAVGLWRAWYESGELQAEEWFEKGKRIKVRYLDKSGREIPKPKT